MTSPRVKDGGDAGKEITDCLGVGSEGYRQNDEKQRKMKPEDSPRKEGRRTPVCLVSDLSRVHEESGWPACGGVQKNLVVYDAKAPLLKEVEGIERPERQNGHDAEENKGVLLFGNCKGQGCGDEGH
jgi:hypothetical protein